MIGLTVFAVAAEVNGDVLVLLDEVGEHVVRHLLDHVSGLMLH